MRKTIISALPTDSKGAAPAAEFRAECIIPCERPGEEAMHKVALTLAALLITTFVAPSAFGQGLTVVMSQTGTGAPPSQQVMQIGQARGRFDVAGPGKVFYNSESKTLRVVPAVMKAYMEYTPESVRQAAAAGRGLP